MWLFSRKLQVTITAEVNKPLETSTFWKFGTSSVWIPSYPSGFPPARRVLRAVPLPKNSRAHRRWCQTCETSIQSTVQSGSCACCNALKTCRQVSQNLCESSCHPSCYQFVILLPSCGFMWLHMASMLPEVPNTKRIFSSSEDISWQHKAKALVTGFGSAMSDAA